MIGLMVHNGTFDVPDRKVTHQGKRNGDFIEFSLLREFEQPLSVNSPDRCRASMDACAAA